MNNTELLNPKVFVRVFKNLKKTQMNTVINSHKRRNMGIVKAAYDVEELETGLFNVRMEYIV